jgi:hypothetical protein
MHAFCGSSLSLLGVIVNGASDLLTVHETKLELNPAVLFSTVSGCPWTSAMPLSTIVLNNNEEYSLDSSVASTQYFATLINNVRESNGS